MQPVRSGKTIYVRFDLNDYSIPPTAVGRQLTLVASPTQVRILDGAIEVARHRSNWDRHERIEDPVHRESLLAEKRKAHGASPNQRLPSAAPGTEALLDMAFQRGHSPARLTRQLLGLLDDYGPAELAERHHRSLERRIQCSSIGRFKPIADFDWNWPKKIDHDSIERALILEFIPEAHNLILLGSNGLVKTMIAKNIAHAADLLYEVINRRYEHRSILITTNWAFKPKF